MKKMYLLMSAAFLLTFLFLFETLFEEEIKQWFEQPSVAIGVPEEKEGKDRIKNKDAEERTVSDRSESFIGMTTVDVVKKFGEPARKDLSAYGYVWWIYPQSDDTYMQIGVAENKVITVFISSDQDEQMYEELNEQHSFQKRVEVRTSENVYEFELSHEDIAMRPLSKMGDHWVQFYFDTFTGMLSSKRIMTEDILLLQRPYSISYRGTLPENRLLTPEELSAIETGDANQIFDLTNRIRHHHGLAELKWEDKVANVAFLHSKEMSINNYFSHESPTSGELGDRFKKGDVMFRIAGENIAAKYVDGLASVEGWLNSEGHRVNLLSKEFTHLGVGVYQDYYTQNFMTP